jgi:hypothetical protein
VDLRRFGILCDTNDLQWHPFELGTRTYVNVVSIRRKRGWMEKTGRVPRLGGPSHERMVRVHDASEADCHRSVLATPRPNMG